MTNSAEARGVTMRVSRKLRDFIQHLQRTESVKQNRNITIVEVSESVVIAAAAYLDVPQFTTLPKDTGQ